MNWHGINIRIRPGSDWQDREIEVIEIEDDDEFDQYCGDKDIPGLTEYEWVEDLLTEYEWGVVIAEHDEWITEQKEKEADSR